MTKTTTSHQESRRYDHVYDTVHTVSSQHDYSKATANAAVKSVERVPFHDNYFSQIPSKYPDSGLRVSSKVDLPAHIQAGYRPASQVPVVLSDTVVTGRNRALYCRRPVVPYLQAAPPEILLAKAELNHNMREESAKKTETFSRVREIGSQTMYRESEAQTDPFTPDYVVAPGSNPEVLQLAHMTVANGQLPISMKEIELIERQRFHNQVEQSLPPITDEASFELRRSLMERLEMFHFSNKNRDIEAIQRERLAYMKNALEEREEEITFLAEQRVEHLRRNQIISKDIAIAGIQHNRIKALRKLAKARKRADPLQPKGRDIIKEYTSYGSRMYAPVLREGQFPDKSDPAIEAFSGCKNDMYSLDEMEQTVPRSLFTTNVKQPKKLRAHTSEARKKRIIRGHLDRMDHILRQQKQQSGGGRGNVSPNQIPSPNPNSPSRHKRWTTKQIEASERPPTPTIQTEPQNEALDNAIILLQRLVKGRAIQNEMYFGKEKRLELIKEVKIQSEHSAAQLDEANRHLTKRALLCKLQGTIVARSLRFLSQELVRSRKEEQVATIVGQAMEVRRVREVEEKGRRQAEENIRSRTDLVASQIMSLHQDSVDSFLDEALQEVIMNKSIYSVAEDQPSKAVINATAKDTVAYITNVALGKQQPEYEAKEDEIEYLGSAQSVVLETMKEIGAEVETKS